jgi:8-oxo-dGTP diphosphatase
VERLDVAVAVVMREGRVLVARRASGSHLGGLWEFPGGKIEPGEAAQAAAARELAEETGLLAGTTEPLTTFVHSYPDRTVRLHVFLARRPEGEVVPGTGQVWEWVSRDELEALPMPEANRAILRALGWRTGAPS